MKCKFLLPLLVVTLSSCNTNTFVLQKQGFLFNTPGIVLKLFEGEEKNLQDVYDILSYYDRLSDNYLARDIFNVYTINQTNDEVTVEPGLYQLLQTSISVSEVAKNYNALCGSLSKKWKESLAKKEVLSQTVIDEELNKMNLTSISFLDDNKVKRSGESEIDLGGIAKGYALDKTLDYLQENELKHYLLNAGSSSILLGEKTSDNGYFTIQLEEIPSKFLKLKNCFISTSSISKQGVKIGDTTYSHIINPSNGSAININDAVIVVTQSGYLGDTLSTSMMNNTIEEIEILESTLDVKTIVIKNKAIIHNTIEE